VSLKVEQNQIIYTIDFPDRPDLIGRLNTAATALLERIRADLVLTYPRSDKIRKEVAQKVSVEIHNDKIKVIVQNGILRWLELGTKPRRMLNLIGKTVPIHTPNGVIYRKVTAEDIAKGGWVNKGIAPHYYVAEIIAKTIAFLAGVPEAMIQIQFNIPDKVATDLQAVKL
jgi:hypothetical protein